MDYSPAKIAAAITAQYSAAHPGFVCRAQHVANVMPLRKPVYGDYDVCSWPNNAQMRVIQSHAFSDYRAEKANQTAVVACPEPRIANGEYDQLFRDSASVGFRGILDEWHGGFSREGDVMAAGIAFGKSFAFSGR